MTHDRLYNAHVTDGSGDVFGRIEVVPLGNVIEFIQNHEDGDFPSEKEPQSYQIEVADV